MTEGLDQLMKIIIDNFDLQVLKEQDLKSKSLFLRKPTFSFRKWRSYSELIRRAFEHMHVPSRKKTKRLVETPFALDINDLVGTEFDLINFSFVKMMPIKTIDLNARDKYFLKQKLNLLFEFHLHILFDERTIEYSSMIEEQRESLDCDVNVYLSQLTEALSAIEVDEYCEYLRNLYYQDLYSLEFINLKIKGRDTMPYCQNTKDDMQIIFETLETAVQSRNYHKIFKSILHTNEISNSTLNDEICLFTTNWIYSKAIIKSLRDEISSFIQLNQPTASTAANDSKTAKTLASKKSLLPDLIELSVDDFRLFSDLDEQPTVIKKSSQFTRQSLKLIIGKNAMKESEEFFIGGLLRDDLFEIYLNELNFLTVDLTRDLLIFLANSINEEMKDVGRLNGLEIVAGRSDETLNEPPIFQLLMHNDRPLKHTGYTINLHTDLLNKMNSKFVNQIKSKLQAFINQLYYRKLLKKHLLMLNHEPDVELYMNTIWQSIISIIKNLNNVDQSFIAEIFLANKRYLQNASSFIARKYLYSIIRNLFETLYLVCSTIYDKFPVRSTTSELQKNKFKLDYLIDQAFLIHLKNEILITVADADASIQIERPNLSRFINQEISRQIITETLSQLITLMRVRLMQCSFYSSPLYAEFVRINEKFKKMDDFFDKQMNVNLFRVLNLNRKSEVIKDPTKVITDIIENEILMRYLNLTPRLECLEQVAELGSQIVLELGMKKNLYFNN